MIAAIFLIPFKLLRCVAVVHCRSHSCRVLCRKLVMVYNDIITCFERVTAGVTIAQTRITTLLVDSSKVDTVNAVANRDPRLITARAWCFALQKHTKEYTLLRVHTQRHFHQTPSDHGSAHH